jgi:hypothetical protein
MTIKPLITTFGCLLFAGSMLFASPSLAAPSTCCCWKNYEGELIEDYLDCGFPLSPRHGIYLCPDLNGFPFCDDTDGDGQPDDCGELEACFFDE